MIKLSWEMYFGLIAVVIGFGLIIYGNLSGDTVPSSLAFIMIIIGAPITYYYNPKKIQERKLKEQRQEINRQQFKDALRRANRFSCPKCGTVVESEQCTGCNAIYPDMKPSKFDKKKSYAGWYILSILVGLLGGIIAYAALRNENNEVAKNCLFVGIMIQVVSMIILAIVWGL
jgi:hypothetical protein